MVGCSKKWCVLPSCLAQCGIDKFVGSVLVWTNSSITLWLLLYGWYSSRLLPNETVHTYTFYFLTNVWSGLVAVLGCILTVMHIQLLRLNTDLTLSPCRTTTMLSALIPIGPAISITFILGWIASNDPFLPGTNSGELGATIITTWLHFINPWIQYCIGVASPDYFKGSTVTFSLMFLYFYFLLFLSIYLCNNIVMYESYFKAASAKIGLGYTIIVIGFILLVSYTTMYCLTSSQSKRKRKSDFKEDRSVK
jgi:hypothetical protein